MLVKLALYIFIRLRASVQGSTSGGGGEGERGDEIASGKSFSVTSLRAVSI